MATSKALHGLPFLLQVYMLIEHCSNQLVLFAFLHLPKLTQRFIVHSFISYECSLFFWKLIITNLKSPYSSHYQAHHQSTFSLSIQKIPMQLSSPIISLKRFSLRFFLQLAKRFPLLIQTRTKSNEAQFSGLISIFPSTKSEENSIKETSLKYKQFRWPINPACKIERHGPEKIRKGKKEGKGWWESDLELKLKLYIIYQVISFDLFIIIYIISKAV